MREEQIFGAEQTDAGRAHAGRRFGIGQPLMLASKFTCSPSPETAG